MEKTGDSRVRRTLRWLLGGLVWMEILFLAESIDSALLINRSINHITADEATRSLLVGGVSAYVVQMQLAYLLLSILAGVLLALVGRVWFPRPPSRRAWWRAMVTFSGIITTIGLLRQARTLPPCTTG